jgi:hypothetical protein
MANEMKPFFLLLWCAWFCGFSARAADDVAMLDPFTVTADRIEEFGFELAGPGHPTAKGGAPVWTVHFVMPNTAAAKAGLRPGHRVLKLDGRPMMQTWREWAQLRRQKRDAVTAGGRVTWSLEVESVASNEVRNVVLTVPTRPPRWGADVWQSPEGRTPAGVLEQGPLAEIAQVVLDNGIWTKFGWPFRQVRIAPEFVGASAVPFLAYYWVVTDETGRIRKIVVSQMRGRTDVVLSSGKPGSSAFVEYLTSPTALLDEAIAWPGRKSLTATKAAAGFATEVEFWTKKVGKVSPRWPLELLPRVSAAAPARP